MRKLSRNDPTFFCRWCGLNSATATKCSWCGRPILGAAGGELRGERGESDVRQDPWRGNPSGRQIMWQRFTERARRVVFFAQEEAGRLNVDYVSAEHLLLGLIRENDCVAAKVLEELHVNLAQLRSDIRSTVEEGDSR